MTPDLWWSLPGPAGFVSEVSLALQHGRNACLLLPAMPPAGWLEAVHAALDRYGWSQNRSIEHAGNDLLQAADPIAALCRQVGLSPDGGAWSAELLVDCRHARDMLVVAEIANEPMADIWCKALAEHDRAVQKLQAHERPLWLLALSGAAACRRPTRLACTGIYQWQSRVGRTEMQLMAEHLLRGRGWVPVESRVGGAVLAELSGAWPAVLHELRLLSLDQMLQVHAVAERLYAGSTDAATTASAQRWEDGHSDLVDGQPVTHPHRRAPDSEFIRQAIWTGEVREVLPICEMCRSLLLPVMRDLAPEPLGEDAELVDEMECGAWLHLNLHQRLDDPDKSDQLRRWLRLISSVRNALAHGRPAEAGDVLQLLRAVASIRLFAGPTV